MTLPWLRVVTAPVQALAGDGVYFRLASVVAPPPLKIGDAAAVGFTKESQCNAKAADHEVKTVGQGKERPLKSGLLAKAADFRDEFSRGKRRPAGQRRYFKDRASIDGSRRYRADHIFDRTVEIALGKKSIVEETKPGRAKNLVTMVQEGDDPGRESLEPGAISSRVGVLDELFGRTPASIIHCQKGRLQHLTYRPQDWIDPVVADHLRLKLVPNCAALLPNVARRVRSRLCGALRTYCPPGPKVWRNFIGSRFAFRHRSIVPKTRSHNFVVTP